MWYTVRNASYVMFVDKWIEIINFSFLFSSFLLFQHKNVVFPAPQHTVLLHLPMKHSIMVRSRHTPVNEDSSYLDHRGEFVIMDRGYLKVYHFVVSLFMIFFLLLNKYVKRHNVFTFAEKLHFAIIFFFCIYLSYCNCIKYSKCD